MEEKRSLEELVERLEASSQRQAKCAQRQFILSIVAAFCCAAMLLLVGRLVPRISSTFVQLETVLHDLEGATGQLAAADLSGMAENVDELVTTSQAGVESAIDKLNAIDFDTLNRAIEDLADVVEPLAKFFNVFNR